MNTPRPPQLPLEDFFRLPERERYRISPDAQHLAYLGVFERRKNLYVQALLWQPNGTPQLAPAQRLTEGTERNIADFLWKGPNTLLFLRDTGGDENHKLYRARLGTPGEECLTPFEGVKTLLVDELPHHPTDVLLLLNHRNPELFDLYQLNTDTAQLTLLLENPGNHSGYITDHEGTVRIVQTTNGVETEILYRPDAQSDFRVVQQLSFRDTLHPQAYSSGVNASPAKVA